MASDIENSIEEFTKNTEGCNDFTFTILVEQPVCGERKVFKLPDKVGHTFFKVSCGDKSLTLGWQPSENNGKKKKKKGNIKTLFKDVDGGFFKDDGHNWHVQKTWEITKDQLDMILSYIKKNNKTKKYNLQYNNCTHVAKKVAEAAKISVPPGNETIWPFPYFIHQPNPGDLGEDLKAMYDDTEKKC